MLGREMNFRWAVPPLAEGTIKTLSTKPRGRRAMALLQVGENRRAERELRKLSGFADEQMTKGILALASRGNMPSLAVRLDNRLFPNGGGYDGAAYPVPAWLPNGGFKIDRALIYALVRQESRFNPKAKSWAGARGLMQLMPRTASFVARDRRFHRHSNKRRTLFKPEVNLALGQKYIEILLADKKIKGNLFLMAAAWNGGPGNLNKWRRKTKYMNDPLFFIESIPSRETRIFIEKVVSNLWAYRNRLGQPTPSLDTIAAGRWPVYTALGQEPSEMAEGHGASN
jgi:soluble lytic murein transglycosylase-like protein